MVNYENNTSSVYLQNKSFCKTIEKDLIRFNGNCSGYCNSYGYEIKSTFIKDRFDYHLGFFRHQTTQNGIIIPINANTVHGIHFHIKGLSKKIKLDYSKTVRLFKKNHVPEEFRTAIEEFKKHTSLKEIKIKDGSLKAEILYQPYDVLPSKIIEQIHSLINSFPA